MGPKRKDASAPPPLNLDPDDLQVHEKEMLFQEALKAKVLGQSGSSKLECFWKACKSLGLPTTEAVVKKARRKVLQYLPSFAAAVDRMRAVARALPLPKIGRLRVPSDAARAERRAAAMAQLAAWERQAPPEYLDKGDQVSCRYDDAIYMGLTKSCDGDQVTIVFDNGDEEDLNIQEVRLVVRGHGPQLARALPSAGSEDATIAGSSRLAKYAAAASATRLRSPTDL